MQRGRKTLENLIEEKLVDSMRTIRAFQFFSRAPKEFPSRQRDGRALADRVGQIDKNAEVEKKTSARRGKSRPEKKKVSQTFKRTKTNRE